MTKQVLLAVCCLLILSSTAISSEVVITDFPIGVGGSIDKSFFKPYYNQLRDIADTLSKYELARAIVTGGADGQRYRHSNDAKNPSLALGRAHAMRNLLMSEFGVDSAQIVLRSEDVRVRGSQYRYVSVRVERVLADVEERVTTVEKRPPIEKHYTEVREVKSVLAEDIGLQVSLGLASSPFGGIPFFGSAVTWKRIVFVDAMIGYSFWNSDYRFENSKLQTRRRLAGLNIAVFPFNNRHFGFVGGWVRSEEVSQKYFEYVRMSEGIILGLRYSPFEYLTITGAYNPSKERVIGQSFANTHNDQFMITITGNRIFGGGK